MATGPVKTTSYPKRGRGLFNRILGGRTESSAAAVYGAPGKGKSVTISVPTVIVLLALWYVVTNMGLVAPLFLPGPVHVIEKLIWLWNNDYAGGTLLTHVLWSLWRVFGAFFVACLLAIPTGIMMAMNRLARGVCDPMIEFYRPIPPLAYLPLAIIWLGIGELEKMTLIYLAVFAPMVINTRSGVRSVAIEQIQVAYSLGATRWQVIWHVILKGAMPEILTGMRVGIGFGWTTLVAAEMVAADKGIGHMVLSAAQFLNTDIVIGGVFVIGVIAYCFDLVMRYLERLLVPWKGQV